MIFSAEWGRDWRLQTNLLQNELEVTISADDYLRVPTTH